MILDYKIPGNKGRTNNDPGEASDRDALFIVFFPDILLFKNLARWPVKYTEAVAGGLRFDLSSTPPPGSLIVDP